MLIPGVKKGKQKRGLSELNHGQVVVCAADIAEITRSLLRSMLTGLTRLRVCNLGSP